MPLSKKKDRERKRLVKKSNPARLESKHNSNLIQPNKLDLTPKAEKLAQLRELIDNPDITQANSSPIEEESSTRIPRYNPHHPQTGEEVVMPSGDIVIVPELDGERNTIPEF